jgi:hypothetical protein
MKRGEEVKILIDYDLFDLNIKDEIGIYIQTTPSSQKHLIYIPTNGEWAELEEDNLERVQEGYVSEENQDFVNRIHTMRITFETP